MDSSIEIAMVAEFTGEIRWIYSTKIYTLLALTNEVKKVISSPDLKDELGRLASKKWLALYAPAEKEMSSPLMHPIH